MSSGRVVLTLPLPPSPNKVFRQHYFIANSTKNSYRWQAWKKANDQHWPSHNPPSPAVLDAEFCLQNLRDEDNLYASLKWVLDALKKVQAGDVAWRRNVRDTMGYFVDDDPRHLTLGKVTQRIDRRHKRVVVTITPRGERGEP